MVRLTAGLGLVLFNISESALAKLLLCAEVLCQTRRCRRAVTCRKDVVELKALFTFTSGKWLWGPDSSSPGCILSLEFLPQASSLLPQEVTSTKVSNATAWPSEREQFLSFQNDLKDWNRAKSREWSPNVSREKRLRLRTPG